MTFYREKKELYVYSPAGDALLVEVVENDGFISLNVADRRLDLDVDSAFDFAEAIIQIANGARFDDGI